MTVIVGYAIVNALGILSAGLSIVIFFLHLEFRCSLPFNIFREMGVTPPADHPQMNAHWARWSRPMALAEAISGRYPMPR